MLLQSMVRLPYGSARSAAAFIAHTQENNNGRKGRFIHKPGTILQGVYKSYGRFGFLITDDDHEDVYISDRDHLNAVNNDTIPGRQ